MLRALLLSLGQLGDPTIIGVLLKSLAATIVLLAASCAALWYAATRAAAAVGWNATVGDIVGTLALVAAFGIAWLLFRAVAVGVMGVFADTVVIAVERRHYPYALATARDVPPARALALGLGSAARAILVNVVLAPVYLALLVTGVGTWLLFFLVNGWLLGRDLGGMVAVRHRPAATGRDWHKAGAVDRFALGVAGTALFMVPVVNLFVPILGAAMATHLFHAGRTT